MNHRPHRLLVSVVWAGLAILVLALLLRASDVLVSAGPLRQIAPSVTNWYTVISDTFDGTYTPTITSSGSADYRWARVLTGSLGFTDTLWCVQGGQGISLTAGIDTYTDGVTTTVTYGPLHLRDAVTVELKFAHWISVALGDGLEWGHSADGTSFVFHSVAPAAMAQWYSTTLNSATSPDLASLVGQDPAYVAFRFRSNGDGLIDLGVFLDDVLLRARYDHRTFMPLVAKPMPTPTPTLGPTPTPTPVPFTYRDDFSNWGSGWPAGDKYQTNPDGSASLDYAVGYTTDVDDGSKVYRIRVTDNGDHVWLTGPAKTLGDFDYRAWVRWTRADQKRWGDEYGVLISPTPIDPMFPAGGNIYTLQIRLLLNDDPSQSRTTWLVKRWDVLDPFGAVAVEIGKDWGGDNLTALARFWNYLRIERIGSRFRFYIARQYNEQWKMVHELDDSSLPGELYIGFFAAHPKDYSYRMVYQFDEVYLSTYRQP